VLLGSIAVHAAAGVYRWKQRSLQPRESSILLAVYYHRRAAMILTVLIPLHILLMRMEPAFGARSGGRALSSSTPLSADYSYVQYVLSQWWFPIAFVGFSIMLAAGYVGSLVLCFLLFGFSQNAVSDPLVQFRLSFYFD
jgi:hypothetical protein